MGQRGGGRFGGKAQGIVAGCGKNGKRKQIKKVLQNGVFSLFLWEREKIDFSKKVC